MKVKKILSVAVLFIGLSGISAADNTKLTEIDKVKAMAEMINQAPDNIWPKYSIRSSPTILYFPKTKHMFAINAKPEGPNWLQLPDFGGIYYNYQHHHGIMNAVYNNSGFTWLGAQKYFVHEMQDGNFFQALEYLNFNKFNFTLKNFLLSTYFENPILRAQIEKMDEKGTPIYTNINDQENVALYYLENKLLEKYLNTNNEDDLKNYVAVDHYRQHLKSISESSANYEKMHRIVDVIPGFVSWNVMYAANQSEGKTALIRGINSLTDVDVSQCNSNNDMPVVEDKAAQEEKVRQYNECLYNKHFDISELVLNSYFDLGPVIGLALDQLNIKNWKESVEKDGVSPNDILDEYYHMNDEDIAQRVNAAEENNNYKSIYQSLGKILTPYLNDMNAAIQAYDNLPGVELVIELPKHERADRYGWKEFEIDSLTQLQVAGSGEIAYPKMEAYQPKNSNHVDVEINHVQYVYNYQDGHNKHYLKLKIPTDAKLVTGSNEHMALTDFMNRKNQMTDKTLDIVSDSGFHVQIVKNFRLTVVSQNQIAIEFPVEAADEVNNSMVPPVFLVSAPIHPHSIYDDGKLQIMDPGYLDKDATPLDPNGPGH